MSIELVDTHCHLNDRDFDEDRQAVLGRALNAGVKRLLVIGYNLASSRLAVEMSLLEPSYYAVIGIHPDASDEWTEDARAALSDLFESAPGRIAAYGEIGLDYHRDTVPRDLQQAVFAQQIAFVAKLSEGTRPLPIVIHCRDAMDDVLAVLKDSGTASDVVMHCFTGDTSSAKACLDAGYYLGIGGVVTFKKSDDVRAAVAYAPLDRILLETDCPYLAPQRWRGRRNEPAYVVSVAETIASVKGISLEEVAAVTTANAERLFNISAA